MDVSGVTIANCSTTKSNRLTRRGMTTWTGWFTSRTTKTTARTCLSARFYKKDFKSIKRNSKLLTPKERCDLIELTNSITKCTKSLSVYHSSQSWTTKSGCVTRMLSVVLSANLSSKRKTKCVNSYSILHRTSKEKLRTKCSRWTNGLCPRRSTTRISLRIWEISIKLNSLKRSCVIRPTLAVSKNSKRRATKELIQIKRENVWWSPQPKIASRKWRNPI
jgi:hypothetical protein